jgi:hypothetical protein
MSGVWPAGAQVRRRVGMRRTPLSSRHARWAPSLRAFFYGRPLVALPVRNGLFVALDGPAFRHLTAPMPAPYDLPHVRGVIAPPELQPDHRGHALHGPALVGKALSPGPFQQQWQQWSALLVRQLARPARNRLGGQGSLAAARPSLSPLRHRSYRCLHSAPDFAQAQPLREECHGTASALCQCFGGTVGSHAPYGNGFRLLMQNSIAYFFTFHRL